MCGIIGAKAGEGPREVVCVALLQLKVVPRGARAECLRILRRFDPSLPVGELRRRMDEGGFAVAVDPLRGDVADELAGKDPLAEARALVKELEAAGAEVFAWVDGRPVTQEFLANWLDTLAAIRQDVLRDAEREATGD